MGEVRSTRLPGVMLRLESVPCARASPAAAAILRHRGRLSSSEVTVAMGDSELEPLDRAVGRDGVVGMEDRVAEVAFGNVVDRDGPAGVFGSIVPGCMPPPPGAVGNDRLVEFGEGVLMTDDGREGGPAGDMLFSGSCVCDAASMIGERCDAGKLASSLCLTSRAPNTEGGNEGSGRFPPSLSSPLGAILDLKVLKEVVIGEPVDGADGCRRFTIFDTFASFGLALMPSNELRGSEVLVMAGA